MEGLRRRSNGERVLQRVVLLAAIDSKRRSWVMDTRLQPALATRREKRCAPGRPRCHDFPRAHCDSHRLTARPVPGSCGPRSPSCADPRWTILTKAVTGYRDRKIASPTCGSQVRAAQPGDMLRLAAVLDRMIHSSPPPHPRPPTETLRNASPGKHRGHVRTVREGTERASSTANWRNAGLSPDPLSGQGSCSNFRLRLYDMSRVRGRIGVTWITRECGRPRRS